MRTETTTMTYQDLITDLQQLSPEQLQQTVTIFEPYEEYIPAVDGFQTTESQDVLDAGHYVIAMARFRKS